MILDMHRRKFMEGIGWLFLLPDGSHSKFGAAGENLRSTSLNANYPDSPKKYTIVTGHGTPFMRGDLGWDLTTSDKREKTLLRLHADAYHFQNQTGAGGPSSVSLNKGLRNEGWFLLNNKVAGSTSLNYLLRPKWVNDFWYSNLPEEEKWERPDGSLVEHPREIVAKRFDGGQIVEGHQGDLPKVPSPFADGTVDLKSRIINVLYKLGFSGVFFDGAGSPALHGVDFSKWAQEEFRIHLNDINQDKLEEWGISDPKTFDIRTYLDRNGLAPGKTNQNPATDPVAREYIFHHHLGVKSFFGSIIEQIEGAFPNRGSDLSLYGNQMLSGAASVYLGDNFDIVNIEDHPTVPPSRIRWFVPKLGLAMGKYEKPVTIEGKVMDIEGIDNTQGLDPKKDYPTLMQIQTAEGYANGAIRKLSLTGWANIHNDKVVNNMIQRDGTVYEELQNLADFIWAQEQLLTDVEPASSTALVYSVPTVLWNRNPAWHMRSVDHTDSFRGCAQSLRENQIPYDVIIFGHDRLWTDKEQLDRLTDYQSIILPNVDAIADSQLASLRKAVENGSVVISSGNLPEKTENFEVRDSDMGITASKSGVEELPKDPGKTKFDSGEGGSSLIQKLDSNSSRQITLEESRDIAVNILEKKDRGIKMVHFVNYDYNSANDEVKTKTDIQVNLRTDMYEDPAVKWISPTDESDLSSEITEEGLRVTIPNLDVWGFCVIAPSGDFFEGETSASEAKEAIDTAQKGIDSAREDQRVQGLNLAEVTLTNATKALEFNEYDKAVSEASTAQDLAKQAYETPIIGIDQSHGQPESDITYDSLSQLREVLDEYEFRKIESWTEEELNEIDLLLIPPALAYRGASHDFTETELEIIGNFVSKGNSLLVFARGGVATDVNELLAAFDMGFDGRPIAGPDNNTVDAIMDDTEPTLMVPKLGVTLGTPVEPGDNARTIGRIKESTEAWLHESPPLDERGESEESAEGLPIYAMAQAETGIAAVVGFMHTFKNPNTGYKKQIVKSTVSYLATQAKSFSKESSSRNTTSRTKTAETRPTTSSPKTPGDTKLSTNSESTAETTQTSAPFLRAESLLASILSILALIKWRLGNDKSGD